MKKLSILLLFVIVSGSFLFADIIDLHTRKESPFHLDFVTDSIVTGGGALVYGTGLLLDHIGGSAKDKVTNSYDINLVNGFDRLFMKPYSEGLHNAGTVFSVGALALPSVLVFTNTDDVFTMSVMFAESFLWAHGTKELLKTAVTRARPYMYFQTVPKDKANDDDRFKSFPSGHSTYAWCGASFTSYVFSQYFPESPLIWPVSAISFSLALTTSVLRIASGNHFFTDVFVGAIIGTACGLSIPLLHKLDFKTKKGTEISFVPYADGICINVKY